MPIKKYNGTKKRRLARILGVDKLISNHKRTNKKINKNRFTKKNGGNPATLRKLLALSKTNKLDILDTFLQDNPDLDLDNDRGSLILLNIVLKLNADNRPIINDLFNKLIIRRANLNRLITESDGDHYPILLDVIHSKNIYAVDFLLEHGADPNITSESRSISSAFVAAEVGNVEILKLLIKSGAKTNIMTDCIKYEKKHNICMEPKYDDKMPKDIALEKGHNDCVEILEENQLKIDEEWHKELIVRQKFETDFDNFIQKDKAEFWMDFFDKDELIRTKHELLNLMAKPDIYDIIVQKFPAFLLWDDDKLSEDELNYIKPSLCVLFLLIGILTEKLYQDCTILLKGGKAIQMVLSQMSEISKYNSNDYDISIIINPSSRHSAQEIASQIGRLVVWILSEDDGLAKKYSMLHKEDEMLVKVSAILPDNKYYAIMDINYKPLDQNIGVIYSENTAEKEDFFPGFSVKQKFVYPNLDALIEERLYWLMIFKNTPVMRGIEQIRRNLFIAKIHKSMKFLLDAVKKLNKQDKKFSIEVYLMAKIAKLNHKLQLSKRIDTNDVLNPPSTNKISKQDTITFSRVDKDGNIIDNTGKIIGRKML
jgi:hypothetical protein